MAVFRTAPVTLSFGSNVLAARPALRDNFLNTLATHGINASLAPDSASVTINSAVSGARLRTAVEQFNASFLESSQAINSLELTRDYREPSLFSRAASSLPGLGRQLSDPRALFERISARNNEQSAGRSALSMALQAATCAAHDIHGQTPESIIDGFYGRQNSGCPEEVRAMLGREAWTDQDGFISAVRADETNLNAWWLQHFNRDLNDGERNIFQSLRSAFNTGSDVPARTASLTAALDFIAGISSSRRATPEADHRPIIQSLRDLARQAVLPPTVDGHRALAEASMNSLLHLHNFIRMQPRIDWGLVALAGASIGLSTVYLGYRAIQTIGFAPNSLPAFAASSALLCSEAHFLLTGMVTSTGVIRTQLQTNGGAGHAHMQPLRRGLSSDPDKREAHAFHLPIVNPAYDGIFWNLQSQTVATRFYGRRGYMALADNSMQNNPRLSVQAAVKTGRKAWARMELISGLLQQQGVARIPSHGLSIPMAGGFNSFLDQESVYLAVSEELQECARQFQVPEKKVKRFGRALADEFERRQSRDDRIFFHNQLTEPEIFNHLIDLGINRQLAVNIAGQAFRSLEQQAAKARVNQVCRKIFSEVDRGVSFEDMPENAVPERMGRIGRHIFGLGGGAATINAEDRQEFMAAAIQLGAADCEGGARDLLNALISSSLKIQDVTSAIITETDENNLSGEFRINREAGGGLAIQGGLAFAQVFNSLYFVFRQELEDVNIAFTSARKFSQFCQKALNTDRPFLAKWTPGINPAKKKFILNRAEEVGKKLAEAIGGVSSGNLAVRMARTLAHLQPGQDPGAELEQVISDHREQVRATVQRVIREEGLSDEVANSVAHDILATFDETFLHFGIFAQEMFQRICRRAGSINQRLVAAGLTGEPAARTKVLEEVTTELIGNSNFKDNLVSVVIKTFGYNRGVFDDRMVEVTDPVTHRITRVKPLASAVKAIVALMDNSGDIVANHRQLAEGLVRNMGLTPEEAEVFAQTLANNYQNSWRAMREAVVAVVEAVAAGQIVPVSPDQTGGMVDVAGAAVDMEELRTSVNRAIRFEYVAYQGGDKAGTTASCTWGDTPAGALRTQAGEVVRRRLEESLGGLRRVPAELLTRADFEVINNFRRDLPAVIDPYFRDPRFVMSFMLNRVIAGDSAEQCVQGFLNTAGVHCPVNQRVRNGLLELAGRLQGRVCVGRLINALGDNPDLDVRNFVEASPGNYPDLSDHQIADIVSTGQRIQNHLESGAYAFVGGSGHWTLRLTPQARTNREAEAGRLAGYQRTIEDFCSADSISEPARNDLLALRVVVTRRDASGNQVEERVSLIGDPAGNLPAAVHEADQLGRNIVSRIQAGGSTDEIIHALEPDISLALQTRCGANANINPGAVRNILRLAVVRIKMGLFMADLLDDLLKIPAVSPMAAPDYEGRIDAVLLASGSRLRAEPAEVEAFKKAAFVLAGVVEDIRIQSQLGLLEIERDGHGRVVSMFGPDGADVLSARDAEDARRNLEETLRWAIFENSPDARQIAEEEIVSANMPEINLGTCGIPGGTGGNAQVPVHLPLAEEFRRLAGVIDVNLTRLINGDLLVSDGNGGQVSLVDRAAALGAQAERTLSVSLQVEDRARLENRGPGLTLHGDRLEMNLAFSAEELNRLLAEINNIELRTQLEAMFHECRLDVRGVCAQLVNDVLAAMSTVQSQAANRNSLFNHNYFSEKNPVMPPWEALGGIRIEDEDFDGFEHSYLNASARIQEHPSQVHVSHRQSGRNFRLPGCPGVFDSGQNSYFGFFTTLANSLCGMYASAGSPPTYSAEAWSQSRLYFNLHERGNNLLSSMNPTTESEDYATVHPLRSVREIGDRANVWRELRWRFIPNPVFVSSLDEGRVSNGSVQDNMLAALGTYFGRWARGNLGVLRNEVRNTPMGFERKIRYSALGAHWFTFAFRANLIITPLWFIFLGVPAVNMSHPEVFLPLAAGTFGVTMGTFINAMGNRGYPLRRNGAFNPEVSGCMECDFAGLSPGMKAIWDGFFKGERPSFGISAKKFLVPEIARPISEMKLPYFLLGASLAGTALGLNFVQKTVNPFMLAAVGWSAYNSLMLGRALYNMNRGIYMQNLNGRYTQPGRLSGHLDAGYLEPGALEQVEVRARVLSEFGQPNYDPEHDLIW